MPLCRPSDALIFLLCDVILPRCFAVAVHCIGDILFWLSSSTNLGSVDIVVLTPNKKVYPPGNREHFQQEIAETLSTVI